MAASSSRAAAQRGTGRATDGTGATTTKPGQNGQFRTGKSSGNRSRDLHELRNVRTIGAMPLIREIVDSLDRRLRDLHREISALEAARSALGGRAGSTPHRGRSAQPEPTGVGEDARSQRAVVATPSVSDPGKAHAQVSSHDPRSAAAPPRGRTSRPPRGKSSKRTVVAANKLEILLADTDGLSTAALAERAGGKPTQIRTVLRQMETAGQIRRSGQRRGTRWHLVTDEERIRARAAELEALSGSGARPR